MSKTLHSSKLGSVKKGRIDNGHKLVFYGIEAVGKSTLASNSTNPIFIDCEDGSARLDVARYPFHDGPNGHVPLSYEEVLMAIVDLTVNEHDFKTLVVDTVDHLEGLIWDFVTKRDSGVKSEINKNGKQLDSIVSYGWGNGFNVAEAEMRRFLNELDALRRTKKMDIILLGHAQIRVFKNPDGEDWDRYGLKLQHSDKVSAAGLVKQWADVVGFCRFEENAAKLDDNQKKAKGFATGRRLIHFERSAAWDAKTRIPLPSDIAIEDVDPWAPIAEAIRVGESLDEAALVEMIDAELARIGDPELTEKVKKVLDGQEVSTLSTYLNNLKKRPSVQNSEEAETNNEGNE